MRSNGLKSIRFGKCCKIPLRGGNPLARAEPFEKSARGQYRFGEYELDLEHASLKRGGEEVALRAKSFEVLAYLVERHGRLVTKSDLIDAVWRDVSVADNSLAQCILEIRRALDDEAQQSIRTVARRGYIFEAAVSFPPVELRAAQRPRGQAASAPRSYRGRWLGAAGFAVVAVAAGALWLSSRKISSTRQLEYIPLTKFTDSAVTPALSPDGRMLAFIRGASLFTGPGDVYVKLLPDGDPVQLTHDGGEKMGPVSFSPDGSRIAYTRHAWEMWSVPVLGGEPSRMLANTEGLTWINTTTPYRVLYSALTGAGLHMGIFTALESRSEQRTVYMPASLDGMAHRSFLSPKGDWAIVAELDAGEWLPCRLVPFDGSSLGRRVGPDPAQCTFAGWTPDGAWMYFSADTGGGYHTWRQRFPDGTPEQVTSGVTEEHGISFAPDGKSFVTSVGESQSTLWIHDSKGERQITFEGYAYLPSFSPDTTRLYYLQRSTANRRFVSGELWAIDLRTGKRQRLLPGLTMENYSVSPDGKQVVFINAASTGRALWIGSTDGSSPPRLLANQDCYRALFAPDGAIYFAGGESEGMHLQKVKADGTGLEKVIPEKAMFLYDISRDGKWLAVWTTAGTDIKIYRSDGSAPTLVCSGCASAGAEERGITTADRELVA